MFRFLSFVLCLAVSGQALAGRGFVVHQCRPGGVAVADIDLNALWDIIIDADGNTYIDSGSANQIRYVVNAAFTGAWQTQGLQIVSGKALFSSAGPRFDFGTGGDVKIQNATATGGVNVNVNTADTLIIENRLGDNATAATLTVTGIKGAASSVLTTTESLTFAADPGDAAKTTSGLIPQYSVLDFVTTRVTTTGTNCTSIDIGDGSTVDLFGGTQTIVAGDTTALVTATIANPQASAAEVTVTANGGNCFDLVIAVTSHYRVFGAATSN